MREIELIRRYYPVMYAHINSDLGNFKRYGYIIKFLNWICIL